MSQLLWIILAAVVAVILLGLLTSLRSGTRRPTIRVSRTVLTARTAATIPDPGKPGDQQSGQVNPAHVEEVKAALRDALAHPGQGSRVITGSSPAETLEAVREVFGDQAMENTKVVSRTEIGMPTGDPVDRLSKLVALRDSGVITPDQFEKLKAKILGESEAQ